MTRSYYSTSADSGTLPKPVSTEETVRVEKYILPFELACQSKHNRFTNTSLDVLQVCRAQTNLCFNLQSVCDVVNKP